ncbi:hypothetical protein DFQ26_000368 [Actinomortierella ambigua]|nr:hypothetical protein DFQ26_000368 [Actinomortierella ambigua]
MDRVDALSIPEICALIASWLDKKELGNLVAPFQQPMRFGPAGTTAATSMVAVPSAETSAPRAVVPNLPFSQAQTVAPATGLQSSLLASANPAIQPESVVSAHRSYRTMALTLPPALVPAFSSTLAKYGHHVFSLQIQARDLPLFVEHCPHVAQLKVKIFSDSGWDHLQLFAGAHPALSKLDLELKSRPHRSGEGVAQLLATQLTHLRTLVLSTPNEILPSTLMSILAAGKSLDSLTVGTGAFIRIGSARIDSTDEDDEDDDDEEDEDEDLEGDGNDATGLVHDESHMPGDGSTRPRSILRRLTVKSGIQLSSILEILRCSPGLQALHLGGNIPLRVPRLCRAIQFSCRLLETLDLSFFSALTDADFAQLVRAFGPSPRLRNFSVPCTYAGDETLLALADYQYQTLEDLNMMGGMTRISSHVVQQLLMQCTRLRRLELGKSSSQHKQTVLAAEDMMLGPWACHQLEYLCLPIGSCVVHHGSSALLSKDISRDEDGVDEHTEGLGSTDLVSGSNLHAIDYTEHVYKQLGALHHLTVLDIGGATQIRREQLPSSPLPAGVAVSPSPPSPSTLDGNLPWTLDSGLHSLHRLSQLSVLRVSGKLENVGEAEMRWMHQYWPKLKSVQSSGPIHPKTCTLLRKYLPRPMNVASGP